VAAGTWFPDQIEGETVVLRRHIAANLPAFRRWYADARVARLTRYQDGPMRPVEIERFFLSRVVGPDSLALAIHVRDSGELIGTCAFSQLDPDNGSALFHITIGEIDAWGQGYGTEATQLMLAHAFETLHLHRVALTVFEFNERAIRSYLRCGFVVEGRAREAIWRDGRRWDEITMSVLDHEWTARRDRERQERERPEGEAALEALRSPVDVAVGSASGRRPAAGRPDLRTASIDRSHGRNG
jgi:RimJ/RimL family protein N-acetyltransferase